MAPIKPNSTGLEMPAPELEVEDELALESVADDEAEPPELLKKQSHI